MNTSTARRPTMRAVLLLPACLVTAWVLVGATNSLRHPSAPGFADLLTALAAWLLVGCAGWSTLISAAAVVETATAGRLRATAWVGCPSSLRRVLLVGLGAAMVGGVPGPAPVVAPVVAPVMARAMASDAGTSAGRPATAWHQALPVPARPLGRVRAGPTPLVRVRPGDTLWQLAAEHLRPSASDGEVALLVERIHRRNRELIGPDPDLIRPGQRLVVPVPGHHH